MQTVLLKHQQAHLFQRRPHQRRGQAVHLKDLVELSQHPEMFSRRKQLTTPASQLSCMFTTQPSRTMEPRC
jgi:hypothetical protein